jgi:Protein of unknown function (DUF3078)
MKKTTFSFLLLCGFITLKAQDAVVKEFQAYALRDIKPADSNGWKKSGTFILNANQGTLQNWASGGEQNTFGINFIFNYNINYRKGRNTWSNYFDLALGFQNATSFGSFRKTDDRIDITSKYGYQLNKTVYAAVLANFNSQAIKGFDYSSNPASKISNFLTPGKVLISLGFDYRPDKSFSLFVSPVTTRWILKQDKAFDSLNKFGVPAFKKAYTELGAFATAKFSKPLNKWANYTGRVDFFSNYKRNPQNIDVFFTNLLSLKFNKWLGSTISLDIVYDDDVIKKTQLKEILGIGLTIKL